MTGTRVWVVTGPAGAGKSTLARALATQAHACLIDVDTATNALLDALNDEIAPGGHWNDAARRATVRPARYAVLRDLARTQVRVGASTVLAAPFTAELAGGPEWDSLLDAVQPCRPRVVWLDAATELLRRRTQSRGELRDTVTAGAEPQPEPPLVPHLRLGAELATAEQVDRVLAWDG